MGSLVTGRLGIGMSLPSDRGSCTRLVLNRSESLESGDDFEASQCVSGFVGQRSANSCTPILGATTWGGWKTDQGAH